ncbi:bifunctional bis(5'-adenosyl)-triphosphatase/adenylylsulfatase FHIT isoform X2 [Benincasa hispida]|uniref:bifunctional bis(5'-adenosyl)-triphosphatase/adenylylsulfatase FHIT isoform X2 n=1 Tax=Benincasa hispida TaxID=102211 RepID=UPI0018FF327A|nr:bifunctional bis(5'-adenosyl)-triphosphatase/adenylylsulfatase FHIT isoform X2 [Benincasa hispida]
MLLRFQASRAFLPLPSSCFMKFGPSKQLGFTSISSSPTKSFAKMASDHYTFGRYKIDPKEVFYCTTLSYAMVNLRPLVPGHVLVCPKREVQRFADLTVDETCDLWLAAQRVGRQLELYHKASSLTFAIQAVRCLGWSITMCGGATCKKTVRRQDKLYPMFTFIFSQGRVAILRKMMRFMMLLMRRRKN